MQSLNRLVLAATIFLISCISQTLAASSITLENKVWELLVVPGSPTQNTVADVFGDSLEINDLFPSGVKTWAVYTFDRVTQNYVMATASTVLGDGEGFWIAQTTGADVQVDMPAPSTGNTGTPQPGCALLFGCFSVALPTDTGSTSWLITGSPFNWSVAPDDMRVRTNLPPTCLGGCTLDESKTAGHTGDSVFVYDSIAEDYQTVSGDDLIEPWSGFWFDVKPQANDVLPELLIPDTSATVQVNGLVTEPDGTVVGGITVELSGTVLAITNAQGAFSIDLPSDASHVLQFVSDDHASQVRIIDLPLSGGQVNMGVTMLKKMLVTTVNPETQFTVVGPFGASVSNDTDSSLGSTFVDMEGNPHIGPMELSITVVDVQDPAQLPAFPGAFSGLPQGSPDAGPLVSQGTVEYSFRDSDGNLLQLADSRTARIQIPIFSDKYPDGDLIELDEEIALWSLNEASGIWEQEGEGTVIYSPLSPTGMALEADVSHFSWWNCDVSPETGTIQVGVFGPFTGTVNVIGNTSAAIGFRSSNVTTSTTIGTLTPPLPVPADNEICVYADVVLDTDPAEYVTTPTACETVAEGETKQILFEFGVHIFVDGLRLQVKDAQGGVSDVNGVFNQTGSIQTVLEPLTIKPLTLEQSVSYEVILPPTGLPAGLELAPGIDGRSATITGTPEVSGNFSVEIAGTDTDNNQAFVTINYDISSIQAPFLISDQQPPASIPPSPFDSQFPISIEADASIDSQVIEFSVFNIGGLATEWSIVEIDYFDPVTGQFLEELPEGISEITNTGQLTVGSPFGDPVGNGFGGGLVSATLRASNLGSNGIEQSFVIPISISRGESDVFD